MMKVIKIEKIFGKPLYKFDAMKQIHGIGLLYNSVYVFVILLFMMKNDDEDDDNDDDEWWWTEKSMRPKKLITNYEWDWRHTLID